MATSYTPPQVHQANLTSPVGSSYSASSRSSSLSSSISAESTPRSLASSSNGSETHANGISGTPVTILHHYKHYKTEKTDEPSPGYTGGYR